MSAIKEELRWGTHLRTLNFVLFPNVFKETPTDIIRLISDQVESVVKILSQVYKSGD
jgi:hypothetical protein